MYSTSISFISRLTAFKPQVRPCLTKRQRRGKSPTEPSSGSESDGSDADAAGAARARPKVLKAPLASRAWAVSRGGKEGPRPGPKAGTKRPMTEAEALAQEEDKFWRRRLMEDGSDVEQEEGYQAWVKRRQQEGERGKRRQQEEDRGDAEEDGGFAVWQYKSRRRHMQPSCCPCCKFQWQPRA